MRIGLGTWTMQAAGEGHADHAALYHDFLEAGALADRLGFDSVWASEHHFVEDGYCPSILVPLAGLAGVTERVRLGTAALILTLRDAAVVAAQANELARLSAGRVELGLGVGYRAAEFEALGVGYRTRERRFGSMLPAVLAEVRSPVWTVAATPAGARRAARHGCGMLLSPTVADDQAIELAGRYRAAGGTGPVGIMRDTWVHSRGSPPPDAVADDLHRLYAVQYASWGLLRDREGPVGAGPAHRSRLAAVLASVTRTAWVLRPEGIGERCRHLEDGGVDLVILRVQWGWHTGPHALEQIELLAPLAGGVPR